MIYFFLFEVIFRTFMLLFFTFCKNKSAHVAYQLTWIIFYWNLHTIPFRGGNYSYREFLFLWKNFIFHFTKDKWNEKMMSCTDIQCHFCEKSFPWVGSRWKRNCRNDSMDGTVKTASPFSLRFQSGNLPTRFFMIYSFEGGCYGYIQYSESNGTSHPAENGGTLR